MFRGIFRKMVKEDRRKQWYVNRQRYKENLAHGLIKHRITRFFYYMFNDAYKLEIETASDGILDFHQTDEGLYYALRIAIHRIEKGLVAVPQKSIFAAGYIIETVNNFKHLYTNQVLTQTDTLWFGDVLEAYFNTVDTSNKFIKEAKNIFEEFYKDLGRLEAKDNQAPYVRERPENLPTYEQLKSLSMYRRSVRTFRNQSVEKDVILNAISIASLSPSACNRQAYFFKIYDKNESEIFKQVVELPPGVKSFKHSIPTIAVVVGKYNTFSYEGDRYNPILDASLASMSFIYALETQGISSCILHWPENLKAERSARKLIGLEETERIIMFIAFGYPALEQTVAKSTKKDNEFLVSFD